MTEILDSQGNTITVGARVTDGVCDGTVKEIGEPDGDTNSYGQTIGVPPTVYVRWSDGHVSTYAAYWNATGPWDDHRDDYTCDDLTVAVDVRARLEYLRRELRAERISYRELAELQSLAAHIEPGDVELLEAAGVPEHEATNDQIDRSFDAYR